MTFTGLKELKVKINSKYKKPEVCFVAEHIQYDSQRTRGILIIRPDPPVLETTDLQHNSSICCIFVRFCFQTSWKQRCVWVCVCVCSQTAALCMSNHLTLDAVTRFETSQLSKCPSRDFPRWMLCANPHDVRVSKSHGEVGASDHLQNSDEGLLAAKSTVFLAQNWNRVSWF